MKPNLPPSPDRRDDSRPQPTPNPTEAAPASAEEDRIALLSWDAPLVPSAT